MLEQLVDKLRSWGEALILMLPNLGVALAILVAAWIASRLVARAVERGLGRVSKHRTLNGLIRKLVRFAVLAAGFLIALNVLDLEEAATTFLAGAGIAGLALGFAFQDLSANFISGIAMAINAPMRAGELVETNDYLGIIPAGRHRRGRAGITIPFPIRTLDFGVGDPLAARDLLSRRAAPSVEPSREP